MEGIVVHAGARRIVRRISRLPYEYEYCARVVPVLVSAYACYSCNRTAYSYGLRTAGTVLVRAAENKVPSFLDGRRQNVAAVSATAAPPVAIDSR